jgi:hypothetical protein
LAGFAAILRFFPFKGAARCEDLRAAERTLLEADEREEDLERFGLRVAMGRKE